MGFVCLTGSSFSHEAVKCLEVVVAFRSEEAGRFLFVLLNPRGAREEYRSTGVQGGVQGCTE